MNTPQPKVNPPLCDICMSSADVEQQDDGAWYCMKQRCLRERISKPIMIAIDKDEPASPGLLNRLWSFLTRDLSDDRRPKHPRPAIPFGGLRSPQNTGSPRPQPPQPAPKLDVGRPPRGGSGALPALPPIKCPECNSIKVQKVTLLGKDRAFTIEKFICRACLHKFTYEDVVRASGISISAKPKVEHEPIRIQVEYEEIPMKDGPGVESLSPIQINVADFFGSEAELASQLSEVIKQARGSFDEIHSTGSEGEGTFVPKPPKRPTTDDDPKPHVEGNHGETARAYRDERRRQGGVPMNQEDGPLGDPKKRKGGIPAERGWAKRKQEPEVSSAWWTAIKWVIGVGASIGLGWLIEWAVF